MSIHKPTQFAAFLSLILMIVGMEVLLLLQSYKIDSTKNLIYGFLQQCLFSSQSIWLNVNVMSEIESGGSGNGVSENGRSEKVQVKKTRVKKTRVKMG